MLTYRVYLKIALIVSSYLCSMQSQASFLFLDGASVSALGNAFAGAGAAGDDASISFYNPAGLMLIEKGQMVGALTYVATDVVLHVDSATDAAGAPIAGAAGEEIFAVPQTPVPALYAAVPINEDWVIGLSFTSPYGIKTDYSGTDLRGETSKTQFITYETSLNLAHQLTQKLSVGIGLNVQYMDTLLSTYVSAADSDGELSDLIFVEFKGDNLQAYPSVGLLYEFTERTRIGLAYRFPVTHDVEGQQEYTLLELVSNPPQTAMLPATMEVPLPGIASLSLFHLLTPKVELLADVTFEGWSRWQYVDINTALDSNAKGVPLLLNDTWRVGLGANYILNRAIKFRTGVAYDQSPITDETRNMGAPDSDRFEVAVGMGIAPKSWGKTRLDIGYMHTFFADAPINQGDILAFMSGIDFTADSVQGDYESSADYIGIQIVRGM